MYTNSVHFFAKFRLESVSDSFTFFFNLTTYIYIVLCNIYIIVFVYLFIWLLKFIYSCFIELAIEPFS